MSLSRRKTPDSDFRHSDVSDESEIDGDDVDMVGEMREALETVQETMDPSSEDDQDDGDRSSSHGSSHDESDHDDQDDIIEAGPGLTADLADAIRQGRLQPVDDVTEQIINDEMEMMGEGADGVQAIWRRQDDDDDGGLSDNDEIGQGFVEVDDQDDDLDDGAAGEWCIRDLNCTLLLMRKHIYKQAMLLEI